MYRNSKNDNHTLILSCSSLSLALSWRFIKSKCVRSVSWNFCRWNSSSTISSFNFSRTTFNSFCRSFANCSLTLGSAENNAMDGSFTWTENTCTNTWITLLLLYLFAGLINDRNWRRRRWSRRRRWHGLRGIVLSYDSWSKFKWMIIDAIRKAFSQRYECGNGL